MRELAATGYMSNRGRQNAASLAAKALRLDWRLGAELFGSLLADADFVLNQGNWAYNAGEEVAAAAPLRAPACPLLACWHPAPGGAVMRVPCVHGPTLPPLAALTAQGRRHPCVHNPPPP